MKIFIILSIFSDYPLLWIGLIGALALVAFFKSESTGNLLSRKSRKEKPCWRRCPSCGLPADEKTGLCSACPQGE